MANILKNKSDKIGGKDVKQLEFTYTIGGNALWYSRCGK